MSFHPKIPRWASKDGKEVLNNSVIYVQEKLDGSQFSFYLDENKNLVCRSKNCIIDNNNPGTLFAPIVNYLLSIQTLLKEYIMVGIEVFGEAFHKPKHNTLCYDRVPKNYLAIFGMKIFDCWVPLEDIKEGGKIEAIGLELIPYAKYTRELAFNDINSEYIDDSGSNLDLSEKISMLGGKIEGWVLKSFDREYQMSLAKYVMPGFSEVKKLSHGEFKIPRAISAFDGVLECVLNNTALKNRTIKAIQHLKERGELRYCSADIGRICKELVADLVIEEKQMIVDALWGVAEKEIRKKAPRGVAEFYHRLLGENSEL